MRALPEAHRVRITDSLLARLYPSYGLGQGATLDRYPVEADDPDRVLYTVATGSTDSSNPAGSSQISL
jgi:hypothetical protein